MIGYAGSVGVGRDAISPLNLNVSLYVGRVILDNSGHYSCNDKNERLFQALENAEGELAKIVERNVPSQEVAQFEQDRLIRIYSTDVCNSDGTRYNYFPGLGVAALEFLEKARLVLENPTQSVDFKSLLYLVGAIREISILLDSSTFAGSRERKSLCENSLNLDLYQDTSRLALLANTPDILPLAVAILDITLEYAESEWNQGRIPDLKYTGETIQELFGLYAKFATPIGLFSIFESTNSSSFLFDPERAFDLAQLMVIACDQCICRHVREVYPTIGVSRIGLSHRNVITLDGVELPAPEVVEDKLAHIPLDLVRSREEVLLLVCQKIDIRLKTLLDVIKASLVFMELGHSSVPGVVQNLVPVHSIQAGLNTGLGVICDNIPDPRQSSVCRVSIAQVIESIGKALESFKSNLSNLAVSGSLGPSGARNLSHQTGIGTNSFSLPEVVVGNGNNCAHAAATQFKEGENRLIALTRKFFGTGWEDAAGITTPGGTASNSICINLARDLAGLGLAWKRIAKAHKLDIPELLSLSDHRALLLAPRDLSMILAGRSPLEIQVLHSNFRTVLAEVQARSRPIVFHVGIDWTHYTFEDCLRDLPNIDLIQVPLNRKLELDFDQLREIIENQFERFGIRPVLLPLSFCNTGFGLSGFDGEKLIEFDSWLRTKYGVEATITFDAAQGGITFGLTDSDLSATTATAREVVYRLAFGITIDPHKYDQPVACSLLVLRYFQLAVFLNSHSSDPSYIKCGDTAIVRGKVQLSAPANTLLGNINYLRGIINGSHRDRFAPILRSAQSLYDILIHNPQSIVIDSKVYRIYPVHQPHSGILGIILVGHSFVEAQAATLTLYNRINVNGSSLSCSSYELKQTCLEKEWQFFISQLAKEAYVKIDPKETESIFCLRFVFRGAGQEDLLETLAEFSDLEKIG